MGAIAQVLEILGHQSEVGVKASGFLIINNKVLKSIDTGHFNLVEKYLLSKFQVLFTNSLPFYHPFST